MAKLQMYQQTGGMPEKRRKTVLREGDLMHVYKKDGLVRFSRADQTLYGCGNDDKCFVGKNGALPILNILHHLGIMVEFVGERDGVDCYRLRQFPGFVGRIAPRR